MDDTNPLGSASTPEEPGAKRIDAGEDAVPTTAGRSADNRSISERELPSSHRRPDTVLDTKTPSPQQQEWSVPAGFSGKDAQELRLRRGLAETVAVPWSEPVTSPSRTPRPARVVASAREEFKDCSPLQLRLWKVAGLVLIFLTGSCYYVSPLVTLFLPLVVFLYRARGGLVFAAVWYLLAFAVPTRKADSITSSRLWKSVSLYFDAEIMFEAPTEEMRDHPKHLLLLFFPHGVISFGGWCFGVLRQVRYSLTASATVLQYLPGVKFLIGPFGMTDSGRSPLREALQKHDVVLYSGGVAELFLSDPEDEKLYFDHRIGCIRLALEAGADISVSYLFGNTRMFRLAMSQMMARLSRLLRASMTLFWGWSGLPIANPVKVVVVTSEIIPMPDYSQCPEKITAEVLKREHSRVKTELVRIFETYKHRHPDYANKRLKFV